MEAFPLKFEVSVPSKEELEKNIQEMEEDAKEHPENAQYFEIKKEMFEADLAVLDDPKNAGVDPNTLAGAEDLSSQMDRATKGLSQEAAKLLQQDPSLYKYGWQMLGRHWITV